MSVGDPDGAAFFSAKAVKDVALTLTSGPIESAP